MSTHNFTIKQPIRKIQLDDVQIGGDSSFYFMNENDNAAKPVFVLEVPIFNLDECSHIVKDYFKITEVCQTDLSNDVEQIASSSCHCERSEAICKSPRNDVLAVAQATNCDILGLKFNISEEAQISEAVALLTSLLPEITKPLLIRGVNNKSIDEKLIPALVKVLDRKAIVGFADDMTYKSIVPSIVESGHILIIRTPIDINLAKEMNILTTDLGLKKEQILIDPDMGGLGYGLEYGYSIMERIKIAGFEGDKMLNMPLIAFAGEESLKVKEAKSDTFSDSWGDFKERSIMFEISTASAVICAGANVVVLQHPQSISTLKNLIGDGCRPEFISGSHKLANPTMLKQVHHDKTGGQNG